VFVYLQYINVVSTVLSVSSEKEWSLIDELHKRDDSTPLMYKSVEQLIGFSIKQIVFGVL